MFTPGAAAFQVSIPAVQLGLPILWPPARTIPILGAFEEKHLIDPPCLALGRFTPGNNSRGSQTQWDLPPALGSFPQGRQTTGEDISEGGRVTPALCSAWMELGSQPFTKTRFSAGSLGGAGLSRDRDKAPLNIYPRA